MNWDSIQDVLLAVAAVLAAGAAIWAAGRRGFRKARTGVKSMGRVIEVIIGSPAVPDPDRPGEFIRPEVPDMGVRMTAVEDKLDAIAIANIHDRLDRQAADIEQARKAADYAAGASRTAQREVAMLREASETWHADELDVLTRIEQRDREGKEPS